MPRALIWLESALAGCLAAGLIEAVLAGGLGAGLAGLGVWLSLVPLWMGGLAAVDGLLRTPPGRGLVERWAEARGELLATAGLGLLAAVGGGAAVRWTVVFAQRTFKNQELVGPAAMVVGFLAFVALGAAALFLARGVRRFGAVALGVGVLGAGVVLRGPVAALGKGAPWAALALPPLAVVVALAWRAWRREPRAPKPLLGIVVVALALGVAGWLRVGAPTVRGALEAARTPSAFMATGLRRLADRDRDGHSSILGGRDCDDSDPSVHPGAADLAGNGVDEDCDGEDRPKRPPRPKRPAKHAPPLAGGPWNVLLVTIDAVRADHLSVYGYERETTPNLERLGRAGLVFERAYAPAVATRHSVPSLLSGRPLADMELDRVGTFLLIEPGNGLLFERLSAFGYATEAHMVSYMRRAIWFGIEAGIGRLVEHKLDVRAPRSGPTLTKGALASLDRLTAGGRPWALWVHYLEPHEPYVKQDVDFGESAADRYDSELRAVDGEVGALLAALKAKGVDQNTLVVVTSDHGEEFGDHGREHHGHQVYEESTRVPLIIHAPGQPARRIPHPVSVMDMTETVANLVGAPPGVESEGISQAGWLTGTPAPDPERAVFSDCIYHDDRPEQRQVAVVRWPWKYMYHLGNGASRLFNLEADPGERRDVKGKHPEEAQALAALIGDRVGAQQEQVLDRLLARRVTRGGGGEPAAEGLSYLGGTVETLDRKARIHTARVRFAAAAAKRADYQVRVEWYDRKGTLRARRDARPLAGRYPTHRWQEGEVVEEVRPWRLQKGRGPFTAKVALVREGKVVWGPEVVGKTAL